MKKEVALPLGLSAIAIVVFALLCVVAIGLLTSADFGDRQFTLIDHSDRDIINYYGQEGDTVDFIRSYGTVSFGPYGTSLEIPDDWYIEMHERSSGARSPHAYHSVIPQEGEVSGVHIVPAYASALFDSFSRVQYEYEQRFDIDLDSLQETSIEIALDDQLVEAPFYSYTWDEDSTWRALYFLDTRALEEYGNIYILEVTVNDQAEAERDAAIAEVEAIINSIN